MLLKKISLLLFLVLVLGSCNSGNYEPKDYLSEQEKNEVLRKILPNFAKLPKGYTYERRFEAALNPFYTEEIKKYKFQHYYINPEDSFHYFMVNRPAPSLYKKRLSIAGKFKMDKNGRISQYEESFWTFKMKEEELSEKGQILFADMVKGKDLAQYMPGVKEEEWIEFPDQRCYYDKKQMKWIVKK